MEQKTRRYQDAAPGYALPPETCSGAIVCSFSKNRLAVVGLAILVMIVSLSVLAPLFTGYDPVLDMDLQNALLPPGSAGHLLGTDDYGAGCWGAHIIRRAHFGTHRPERGAARGGCRRIDRQCQRLLRAAGWTPC